MSNTYNYPCIRAWHAGSSKQYYIDALVKLAQDTDAPRNATYAERDFDGTKLLRWSTTDDIKDLDTRADMQRIREALA